MLALQLAERLRHEFRFVFVCLDELGSLGEELQSRGAAAKVLHRRSGLDWRCSYRLAKTLRQENVDLVHAHQYTPFFYAALARILAGFQPRLIVTEHGRHFPDQVAPLRRAVNRLFLEPRADAVTAVCRFCAHSMVTVDGFRGARVHVISNGVATAANANARQRQALREDLGLADKRRYLVNVARQHPIKDHATLLKAFYHVARNCGDVDLLLVGDGPLRRDLHELAVTLGIKERVHFLGVRNDVPNLLRLADAFVLTSLSEAASLTILEAMAASLPVVVTAVGGNPEIVRHGVEGLLVPPRDSARLAEALQMLLSGTVRATAMGRAGAERVRKHYQLEHTVLQYRALYGRLTRSA